MKIFLFILIVTSGMEIYGYPVVDVILVSIFFFIITVANKRPLKTKIDWVLVFILYIILQIFRGMYVLSDFRMVYWLFFFIIVGFSHQYFYGLYKSSRIDQKFSNNIFNYSVVYFLIYGLLGFLIENPDDYQGTIWVGSSGAFLVIIPLFCSHLNIFQNSGYSLSKFKLSGLLIFLCAATIHQSRIGVYLFFIYLICLTFRATIHNLRKFVLMSLLVAICFFTWAQARHFFYDNPSYAGNSEIRMVQDMFDSEVGIEGQSDVGRIVMVISIYQKLLSSPVELIFGSGWYTSRLTLKPFEIENRKEYGLRVAHLADGKPLQVISLAAIISDLGIIGLFLILYFFFKSASQIWQTKSQGRMIFLIFLMSNWLFFMVAYSTTSILSFLLFLPNGIIVALARANSPSSQLVRRETKND